MAEAPALLLETPGVEMDALSDVLRATRLKGGVFLHAEFSDPWCLGVQIAPKSCAPFLNETSEIIPYHYVLEGVLRVRARDGATVELYPGEAVLFPRNDPHLLGGDLRLPPVSGDEAVRPPTDGGLATIRIGGGGARTRIVCGFLGGENLENNPVVSTLPAVLPLDARQGRAADWIRSTFSYAADEIAAGRIGSETVLSKISELLFVEAVRRYVEMLPEDRTGWLAGLRDPHVSRALSLMHARPGEGWTVDRLAREVGVSRSALTDRFGRLIGVPPMQYLTHWRMQVAARELREGHKSIMQIAELVGYDSEAAFSRAFKRAVGTPPATWRRQG